MLVYLWLIFVFIIGTVIGSFLNVCIVRMPVEKSILWPGSRCGKCYRPIAWYDNLPLISYLWLRGKCRNCEARFSARYLVVELLTGFGFVGLFYVEVVLNIHSWPLRGVNQMMIRDGWFPWQWVVGYAYHTLLFCFLVVASFCDLSGRAIPLPLTLTGTAIGLIGAVLFAWPFPHTPEEALRDIDQHEIRLGKTLICRVVLTTWGFLPEEVYPSQGVYPWPMWGPLPAWAAPGGNWQTGLATGLLGALAGTLILRSIGFLFGSGLGKQALGLGDADLMMMAGAFLGWQPVIIAFFIGCFLALPAGIFQKIFNKDGSLPFGPSLSLGVMITFLCWQYIGPQFKMIFFDGFLLIVIAVFGSVFIFLFSFLLRLMRPKAKETAK